MRFSDLSRLLQSGVFYTAYCLFTLVYISVATAFTAIISPFFARRTLLILTRWFIGWYGVGTVRLGYPWVRFRVKNNSGLAPGQPCLFVSNHQSIGDPFIFSLVARKIVFLSNHWPFRIPILGIFARVAGYLNTQALSPEVLTERAREFLADGVSLVCFAEGTRTRTGALGVFHTTGFRLALATGAPIVPLCIAGLFQIVPKGSALLRPGVVRIHALPALRASDYEGLNAYQLKSKVRDLIACELNAIEGEVACA